MNSVQPFLFELEVISKAPKHFLLQEPSPTTPTLEPVYGKRAQQWKEEGQEERESLWG